MRRILTIACFLALAGSCTTVPAESSRWWIRLSAPDGSDAGAVLVEMTGQPASGPCLTRQGMNRAVVVQKQGFEHDPVGEAVAIDLSGGRFYADLTSGICDATLTVDGPLEGDTATGDAQRSTIAGPQPAGRFVAKKAE